MWLFLSGPLDASASEWDIQPTPGVRRVGDLIGAPGHVTFGGRLEGDIKGRGRMIDAIELTYGSAAGTYRVLTGLVTCFARHDGIPAVARSAWLR